MMHFRSHFLVLALAASLVLGTAGVACAESYPQAARVLRTALGPGKALSGSSQTELLRLFVGLVRTNPAMIEDIATLMVVAHPDMADSVLDSLESLHYDSPAGLADRLQQAAENPSMDQLAALVQVDGESPAADETSNNADSWPESEPDGSPR